MRKCSTNSCANPVITPGDSGSKIRLEVLEVSQIAYISLWALACVLSNSEPERTVRRNVSRKMGWLKGRGREVVSNPAHNPICHNKLTFGGHVQSCCHCL